MFGLKGRKKVDHIVVPPESEAQEVVDPYHEPITENDMGGIALAKQELPEAITPLEDVADQEVSPNQFVVGEVPSVPTAEEVASPEPSLEQMKARELELEAHFAKQSEVEIQREQKAGLVQQAEQAFAEGRSPATLNSMVEGLEQDIRSLGKSAAQASREVEGASLPQGDQVGAVYQEKPQEVEHVAPPVPIVGQQESGARKIPGVGNESGMSLPGYQQKENLQTAKSVNRDGQIVRTELQPKAETLVGQTAEMTPKAARGIIEMAYRKAEFDQTRSFDQLYAAIDTVEAFDSSVSGIYAREELKSLIEAVRTGGVPVNVITRAGGLRAKVLELMSGEAEEQEKMAA